MGLITPNYKQTKRFEANLSGTAFSISIPPQNRYSTPQDSPGPLTLNLYDGSIYHQSSSSDETEVLSHALRYIDWLFLNRRFFFFVSDIAQAHLAVKIFKFDEFSSLFNTAHFESAVERLLFAHGDAYASSGLCRLNWRVENYNNTEWVVFENDGRYGSCGIYNPCKSILQSFYLTPISDEHLLAVFFTQVERLNSPGLATTFADLRERVMSTAQLSLSQESTRQKHAVQAQCPEQRYSQHLPPYEFDLMPYPERDDAHTIFMQAKGVDYVNSLTDAAYSNAIDAIENELKQNYYAQVDKIMASHLKFKDSEIQKKG